MASVSISHGNDIIQTLEDSLKLLGGIHQFIEENHTVFIKPDLSLPLGPPITIHPRILGHVVRLCLDAGANKVYIGFNPFDGVSSRQLLKLLGLDYYLEELGASLLRFEDEKFSDVKLSNPLQFKSLSIPKKLLESDVFISLVAPRCDVYGYYALGITNYLGLLNDIQKQELIQSDSLQGLLDYYRIKPPQLTIWDAFNVGEGQGPFNLRAVPYHLVLTSADLPAGDTVMSYLMGTNPERYDLLKKAVKKPITPPNIANISILGEKIDTHRKPIKESKISSKSLSPYLEIVQGRTCLACQTYLRYWLDFLFRFCEKDIKDFGGFTCFIGDLPASLEYILKTGVISFGTCAINSQNQIKFKDKTQKKKFYFQFPGCPPNNLYTLEKFCLKFKPWLPSLEIIEEFIRKWTTGRQFSPETRLPQKNLLQ